MTTATSTADVEVELLPGYYVEPSTGAWLTLPWPDDPRTIPSLAPAIFRWCRGLDVPGIEGLVDDATGEPLARLEHHLTGKPWEFTLGQRRFLHLWYAVRPDGRWMYRSGVKRGAKGTGKDPLAAAICHIELRGPSRFSHFNDDGFPIGAPHRMALVQIAANSEGQAGDVLQVANGMVSDAYREEHGFDTGITRTITADGSKIELLTHSEKSSEGDPATAILLNESHHMTKSSGGQKVAAVARRNVGKSPDGRARLLELTNAHLPGEESVAEDSFDAWQKQVAGQTRRADILYDSREAAPNLRMQIEEELELGIAQAYGDSPWTDQERIRDEAQDPRTSVSESIRFYFNSLPTNEMAWVDSRKFDAKAKTDEPLEPGEAIALFLDCSKSTDATVIDAARMSDGHAIAIDGWQKPHGDRGKGWLAPRNEVDAIVRHTFATYDVQWFGVDPSPAQEDETEAQYWAEYVDQWHRDFREKVLLWATPGAGGNAVSFDMRLSMPGGKERNRLFTAEAERVAAAIDEDAERFTWDGNPMLRVHVHNARRRPNQWGITLGKASRSSSKLVDHAVAMVGAQLGRRLVLNSGKTREKKRTGRVW